MEEKKEHKEHTEHAEHEHSEHEHSEHADHSEHVHKRRNDWKIFSGILGVVIIILLVFLFYGKITGTGSVSSTVAGQKVIDFALAQGIDAKLVKVEKKDTLYGVVLLMQGKEVPVYVTLDGKNLVPSIVPLDKDTSATDTTQTPSTPQEVPKSAKPKVEAYIFSYCPYGLQFEKALFPVYDLLKNKADINIVAIGAMHGEYEKIESYRQVCIEKLYGKDKLFKYLKAFNENAEVGNCRGTATCVDPLIAKIYTSLSIVKSNVDSCMAKDAQALYDAQGAKASSLGIGGSPTFVINGVQVQVDRTPDAIKEAVCNAFNTKPSECDKKLSTSAMSAGFGASSGSAASANSAAGCAPA